MNNYWLDKNKYTTPEITQAETFNDDWTNGKWVVTRHSKEELEKYVPPTDENFGGFLNAACWPATFYLHKDGEWIRNSTYKDDNWDGIHKKENFTGYYDTQEEAEATLRRAL